MADTDIHIRTLQPEEWKIFRDMRLHALKTEPGVYGSTHQNAANESDESWKSLLTSQKTVIFGLFDGQKLIGITGAFPSWGDPAHCFFGMSYILPPYRGQKLSHKLFKARIEWAKSHPDYKKIVICHRDSNTLSALTIQRFGFTRTGTKTTIWPDGVQAPEFEYELDLNATA